MGRRARLTLQRRIGGRMFARWRAAMVVTAALAATPAHADTVADFYKGKQINLIVRKDAPVKSIDEARRADLPALVLGGTAEGPTGNDVPVILRDTIGLHVK